MKCLNTHHRFFASALLALSLSLSGLALPFNSEASSTTLTPSLQNPACVRCTAGRGGQLFSTGEPIKVTIRPSSSDFTSIIFLNAGGNTTVIGKDDEAGKMVTVGPFPAGTELVFGIAVVNPPGQVFVMGTGNRNMDGAAHGEVTCESGRAIVGFSDFPNPPASAVFDDAVIEVTCAETKCDTFSFRSPQYFLDNLNRLPRTAVMIGGVNFNNPVSTDNVEAIRQALQGGSLFGSVPTGNPQQQLNRDFVAAQLSLALAGGTGSPVNYNSLWARLGCPGLFGDFIPVTLSNGAILGPDSMLKDLFIQTQSAGRENRAADCLILSNFFAGLCCNDGFGFPFPASPPPPRPLPDLIVESATCTRVDSRVVQLTITIKNIGNATAPPSVTTILSEFGIGSPFITSVGLKELAPMNSGVLTVDLLRAPGCPNFLLSCPLLIVANGEAPTIPEKTRINNTRFLECF